MIIGDFQCCPDKPITQRTVKPNALSSHLSEFLTENNLIPIDITQGEGPLYTYHHISLPNKSYIDHILTSQTVLPFVTKTTVMYPEAINTGDHLPVSTTLEIP